MISKFSKMQNGLFAKIVLSLTALSFVSLFGVSGYINTANNNKTVIKVDNLEMSQSEFNYLLQRELAKYKNMIGDDTNENEEMINQITSSFAKAKLDELIISNTMKKNDIDFRNSLVSQIIHITPQFQYEGKFNKELYNQYLRTNNMTEQELINDIKRNVARQLLLDTLVAFVKVPSVLEKQMQKVLGQRRTFNYIKIENDEISVDREPTAEEIDQYYSDLTEEFVVPEKRNITVFLLTTKMIADKLDISEEDINAYKEQFIDEFEQPEKREVLQMVFSSKELATEYKNKLNSGADFLDLAKQNGQTEQDTNFGFVSASDLSDDLSSVVFSLKKGGISDILEINNEWQILKVADVKPAYLMPKDEANAKIIEELKQERVYDKTYEIMKEIEDKIGEGKTLNDISVEYGVTPITVSGLSDDGSSNSRNVDILNLLKNKDIVDTAFSYNVGEISQTIETDNGIAVIQIDDIIETHIQNKEEVISDIKEIWLENEKASIAQEIVDNISHDLESGDTLRDVAQRYGFKTIKTRPLARTETFDDLSYSDIKTLFLSPKNYVEVLKNGDDYIVAETSNIYDDTESLTDDETNYLQKALYMQMVNEASNALLKGYAKEYDIEVNYNRMGLND